MRGRWKIPAYLYAGLFAVVGGSTTFQVLAFDGDITVLTVLWWLAFPVTPILASASVFLSVFLAYLWGNGASLVVMTLLCGSLFFAAGYIQAAVLHRIVQHFRRRGYATKD